MGMYNQLADWDLLDPIAEQLDKGILELSKSGKIRQKQVYFNKPTGPWIHSQIDERRACYLWLRYYFFTYGIISRNCFNCWKTVCRPDTIDQLFAMEQLQKEMYEKHGYPSKCGIEKRPYGSYKGPYAAFWYNPIDGGLVEARRRTKVIEKRVHEEIGDLPVILKRACTEMEEKHGPSNEWVYREDQHLFEDALDDMFEFKTYPFESVDAVRMHVHKSWIEWGFERGDPTVAKYVDNFPEDFGITRTIDYHKGDPKIASGIVKGGRLGSPT